MNIVRKTLYESLDIVEYLNLKSESVIPLSLYEKMLVGEPISVPELRKILNNKVVNFEFIKLDGDVRPAKGTTMMKYIPPKDHPDGLHPSSDKVATFYDLTKNAWRSVSNKTKEAVLVQDEDTGKLKVQVSDKKPKEEPTKPEMPKVPGAEPRPIPPKVEPVVRPSIRPEVKPLIPKPEEIEPEIEEVPLDIEDTTITADDIEDNQIISPEVPKEEISKEPELEDITFPEEENDIEIEEELPPEEDITFPEDEDEEIV